MKALRPPIFLLFVALLSLPQIAGILPVHAAELAAGQTGVELTAADLAKLTPVLECKLTADGKQYVRVLKGPPSQIAPFYEGTVPLYIETPAGLEKLFAVRELEDQKLGLHANHNENAPRALDYYVDPASTRLTCIGANKDILLFSSVVEGVDPRWHTSVIFAYNPYKKSIERTDVTSWDLPLILYFGKDETTVVSINEEHNYKYQIVTRKNNEYHTIKSNNMPESSKYYNFIRLPKSLWNTMATLITWSINVLNQAA